jgi:hypothetical protein
MKREGPMNRGGYVMGVLSPLRYGYCRCLLEPQKSESAPKRKGS